MSADTTGEDGRTEPAAADVDALVTGVLVASRALVGVSARSLADIEGTVTVAQFRMLVVLEGAEDARLNRLAELLGVTSSTALRMVDRLVSAGLVTRRENAADRREVLIRLTTDGARLVRRVTERRREEIARIVGRVPEGVRADVLAALHVFAEAADEPTPGPDAATRLGW